MPLSEVKRSGQALIGIWRMTETEEDLSALLLDREKYQSQLDAFASAKRRIEFLTIRVLLQHLCETPFQIAYQESGKPYLLNSSWQISISHTKGYAAIILHPLHPVAIDIEQRSDKVLRLQSKFMNDSELLGIDPKNELSYALICWSAKETLFKIMPEEEIDFKKHLQLSSFQVTSAGKFHGSEFKSAGQREFEIYYINHPDYVMTWIA